MAFAMLQELRVLDFKDPAFSTRGPKVIAARDLGWCARTPYGLAVLRYRECGQILRDRRFRQGSYNWPETVGINGPFAGFWKASVIGQAGERHARLRALAVPALSEGYVASLIPAFERSARELCENLCQSERCEFQSAFCNPFAGQAITSLLGMSAEEWRVVADDAAELGLAMGVEAPRYETRFNAACERLSDLTGDLKRSAFNLRHQQKAERVQRLSGALRFAKICDSGFSRNALIKRVRRGQDRESYVARMVAGYDRNSDCSFEELLNMIAISIFGGVDTTRALLGLGLSLFIDHPAQWQALRRDAWLVPAAVEEFIRARPTTTWATREATESVIMNGVEIPKGTVLHLLVQASARDPDICDDPRFDITVKRKRHFGFGGGAHHCIGHLVARTDIAAALRALRETFASVTYDGVPEWLPDSGNTGALSLPVRYAIAV
jgi:cytochrome P450